MRGPGVDPPGCGYTAPKLWRVSSPDWTYLGGLAASASCLQKHRLVGPPGSLQKERQTAQRGWSSMHVMLSIPLRVCCDATILVSQMM
jgi:hypothetical protein